VAPVQGGTQGLMAGRCRARAADQHGEDIVQPFGQLGRGHDPHPRGRQLDREGQAIESPADRQDPGGVLVGDAEGWPHQLRPLFEQRDGVGSGQGRRGGRGFGLRQRQRRHLPAQFALHPERLTARRQDDQGRAGRQQVFRHVGRGLRHVLAVVEHHQHPVVGYLFGHRLGGVLARSVGHAELGGDGLPDDGLVVDLGERHPVHPGREALAGGLRGGQRQSCLARPAWPGEGDQPAAVQGVHHVAEFARAAHQRGKPHRELRSGQRHPASVPLRQPETPYIQNVAPAAVCHEGGRAWFITIRRRSDPASASERQPCLLSAPQRGLTWVP
jgi:hypothetical protein